ncbi:relaxase/mobilization nuclease domain-containing protein [Pseudoflavitalea rhizosphaerae]|uniref:relaxase/mobilization nuclease domain-containing protein n=1 Tax=Pseudoflavitalea rhizosphaerae TaxID=1884793 RepID=UPI000F8E04A1|nr:relaxase/mobilization nuclease domain-containing protein [Pseudoflavitalea rhizosphaerae]
MVARVSFGESIKNALSYNENKLRKEDAELILASRFSCDIPDLNFSEKLTRFERIIQFNPEIQKNTAHIILSFSPFDVLSNEKLQLLAYDYMKRIGFEDQPYLVYLHNDTNVPHLHIVSTTIRPDGSPIYLHNFAKRLSEPARKGIEDEFGLIPAESMKNQKEYSYSSENTKSFITNTVRDVIAKYHITTLDDFNAILKKKGIFADPGLPGSRMHEYKGLVYSKIDRFEKREGVPIKASAIYTQPTLATLKKKFEKSQLLLQDKKKYLEQVLSSFFTHPGSFTQNQFLAWMRSKKVDCEFLPDAGGNIQDIRFVDHFSKAVFSCKHFGITTSEFTNRLKPEQFLNQQKTSIRPPIDIRINPTHNTSYPTITSQIIDVLLSPESARMELSSEFLKKKKKRKKKSQL